MLGEKPCAWHAETIRSAWRTIAGCKESSARQGCGTTDSTLPGVARTAAYQDHFLDGPCTVVNPPRLNPPFDCFWLTPRRLRGANCRAQHFNSAGGSYANLCRSAGL